MTFYGRCQSCGEPVTSFPAYQITGFEVPRGAGGTNHVLRRSRVPERVWHEGCLPDEAVHPDQEAMAI